MPTASTHRKIVFLSPTFPAFHGNGLAMRAAASLHLLSRWNAEVHLLVIPIHAAGQTAPDAEIARLCKSWRLIGTPEAPARQEKLPEWFTPLSARDVIPREWRQYTSAWQSRVSEAIAACHPDLVMAFRFYLSPFIHDRLSGDVPVWLDLDELESTARARLSHIYAAAGKSREAFELRMEALAYETLEQHHLQAFERVFTSSALEAKNVHARCADTTTCVLPNVYPADRPQKQRSADGTARLLYVGSFGHYPNQDAVDHFCLDVLPRMRAASSIPIQLTVIGSGQPYVGEHPSIPGVYFSGAVRETTSHYAECDAVIVPLRAAGGTRIKVLEAFSHQRAVVATSIGAEGLEVTAGIHLRIADGAEQFARECLDVLENTDERCTLAERGHAFFQSHHTLAKLETRLPQMFGSGAR